MLVPTTTPSTPMEDDETTGDLFDALALSTTGAALSAGLFLNEKPPIFGAAKGRRAGTTTVVVRLSTRAVAATCKTGTVLVPDTRSAFLASAAPAATVEEDDAVEDDDAWDGGILMCRPGE